MDTACKRLAATFMAVVFGVDLGNAIRLFLFSTIFKKRLFVVADLPDLWVYDCRIFLLNGRAAWGQVCVEIRKVRFLAVYNLCFCCFLNSHLVGALCGIFLSRNLGRAALELLSFAAQRVGVRQCPHFVGVGDCAYLVYADIFPADAHVFSVGRRKICRNCRRVVFNRRWNGFCL